MNCGNCGREINNGVKFCPWCGSAVTPARKGRDKRSEKQKKGKRNWVILALALLVILTASMVGIRVFVQSRTVTLLMESIHYVGDDLPISSTVYEYDTMGQVKRITYTYEDDIWMQEYLYNEEGFRTTLNEYENGNLQKTWNIICDDLGRKIWAEGTGFLGRTYIETYSYDEKGNVLTETYTMQGEDDIPQFQNDYTYYRGSWPLTYSSYIRGKLDTKEKYTYSDKGKLISYQKIQYSSEEGQAPSIELEGTASEVSVKTGGKQEIRTMLKIYDSDGKMKYEKLYDDQGNLLMSTEFLSNGAVWSVTVNRYEKVFLFPMKRNVPTTEATEHSAPEETATEPATDPEQTGTSLTEEAPVVITNSETLVKATAEAFQSGDMDFLEALTSVNRYNAGWGYELSASAMRNTFSLWLEDGYDLTYQVDRIYALPDADWQAFRNWLTSDDFDFSIVEQVNVADVTFTGRQGDKTVCISRKIWMTLENGAWKLLHIDAMLDWNGHMLAADADAKPEGQAVSQKSLTPEAAMAYLPVAEALEASYQQFGEYGSFWCYAFLEDFDQDGEPELLVGDVNGISFVCSLYDYEDGVMNVRFNDSVIAMMAGGGCSRIGAAYYQGRPVMTSYIWEFAADYTDISTYRIYAGENYALTRTLQADESNEPYKYYVDGQQVSKEIYNQALAQYEGMEEKSYLIQPKDLVTMLQRVSGSK